jgi:phosphate transport system substrate-binding protein
MKTTYLIAIVAIAILVGAVAAYVYLSQPSSNQETSVFLNGAGATFPQPFLNATIQAYHSMKPNVDINYQGGGSGAGITGLTQKTVDFAATDAPLTDSQRTAAPGVLHIPETIGAVTLAYNLPGVTGTLQLSGDVVARIFLGTITRWNDPAITTLNPTLTLPDQAIATVHRAESSGTTNVFTKYLSLVSETWSSQIGSGTSVEWPSGIGASGNANVASTVTQTPNSIGYVELAYALQNNMPVASIQNSAGNFIAPSLASTTTAVQSSASSLPSGDQSWTDVSLLNAADPQAYPIVAFTYLIEYKELNVITGMTLEKATAIVQYMWYVIHDGQQLASSLGYATLPSNVVQINEATIQSITFEGQTLPVT